MSLLSIIVPVYQVEQYLEKCIKSILQQTFSDFELILIDDGSKDGSGKICDDYAKLDKRIKVIHQENQGVSSARNAGLNIAKGRYIAFVDADDWIEKEMFSDCMEAMKVSKVDVLCHGMTKDIWIYGDEKSSQKGPVEIGIISSKQEMGEYINRHKDGIDPHVFCYLFDYEIVKDLRFDVDMPFAEDNVFVLQALSKANTYEFIKNCQYHYNARIGSAAYKWQSKMVECNRKTLKEIQRFLRTLQLSKEEECLIISIYVINAYSALIYNLCLPTCTLSGKEKRQTLKYARKVFQLDRYKKFYKIKGLSLFEKLKIITTFLHLEIILIVFGPLYCKGK